MLVKKCLTGITRDERYRKAVQGLHATIGTLNRCYNFVATMPPVSATYDQRVKVIVEVLSAKKLERLRNIDIYRPLTVSDLAVYDYLLKSKLQGEIRDVLAFIAELDVNLAVSAVGKTKGFTYAKALASERNVFMADELCHPCIDGAVGNSISLSSRKNVLFLTGANVAGKSTLMKSVGIGMYLAHMGFPVAARAAAAGHDTETEKASDAAYSKLPGCCRYDRSKE